MSEGIEVPTDAVLAVTSAQRNTAQDELATMTALVQKLIAERDQLRAELAQVRSTGAE